MKTFFTVLVIIVIIGIGYYFISKPTTPSVQPDTYSTVPTPIPATTNTPAAPAQSSAITIQNFAFSPASVTVKVGTTITWTNQDNASHTVTSDSGSLMNSPSLATGKSYKITFTTPGTFTYHCSVHPMMHGTVVVTN